MVCWGITPICLPFFFLGWLAYQLGIQKSFGFIMVLAVLMFILMMVGYLKSRVAVV